MQLDVLHMSNMEKPIVDKIMLLYWKENLGLRKIAGLLSISHTTVWRVVQQNPPPTAIMKRYGTILAEI